MNSTRRRILFTMTLLLVVIILVPVIPELMTHATRWFVGVLLLCALWALIQKSWLDVMLTSLVELVIGFSHILLPNLDSTTRLIALFGLMAYVGLHLVLLIGPWSRFIPQFVWVYKYRRHLGVAVFLLALAHASLIFSLYFSFSLSMVFSYPLTLLGFTALFIMAIMAATSFDYVQKKFSLFTWETLHLSLLLIYSAAIAYHFSQNDQPILLLRIFFVAILVYWTLISPFALPARLLRYVNGWKQLHLLVYAAYGSTLMHVWMARVSEEVLSKKIGFIALAAFVVGSHLIGWILFWKKKRQENSMQHQTKQIDGKTYTHIGSSADFIERKGKKIIVEQKDLALFRYEGKVYALSNRCPHQGGPLSLGKIRNGYVECPWHGYQFGVKDGKGPAEFGDEIPLYPVHEENGHVYVYLNDPSSTCCEGSPSSVCCSRVSTKKS